MILCSTHNLCCKRMFGVGSPLWLVGTTRVLHGCPGLGCSVMFREALVHWSLGFPNVALWTQTTPSLKSCLANQTILPSGACMVAVSKLSGWGQSGELGHFCGQCGGRTRICWRPSVLGEGSPRKCTAREALLCGCYSGGICMGDMGLVVAFDWALLGVSLIKVSIA